MLGTKPVDCESFRKVEDSWPNDVLRALEFNYIDLLYHGEHCEECRKWLKDRKVQTRGEY